MALGRRSSSMKEVRNGAAVVQEEGFGYGVVVRSRSFGRKRIEISRNEAAAAAEFFPTAPLKRLRSGGGIFDFEEETARAFSSPLESLSQDILVKILCGVEHDDLEQLINVSKAIRDATLVAKETHFKFSTPRKVRAFRTPVCPDEYSGEEEIETPNAPMQVRPHRSSRLGGKCLDEVAVSLFASPTRRRGLFMEEA